MLTNFPMPSPEKGSQELTEEFIRLRAYELFEARGGVHGRDVEDWLQAEAEILGTKRAASSVPERSTMRRAAKAR